MNYCTHEACRLAAAGDLVWLAGILTHRAHDIESHIAEVRAGEVRCRCVERMQHEGAIEYDSWGRDFAARCPCAIVCDSEGCRPIHCRGPSTPGCQKRFQL